MEDNYFEKSFNLQKPDDEAAEAMLKRLEKQEQAKANNSFKESLGNRVWRTKDGRYVDFNKMDDNHLMNSYNLVERNIKTYLKSAGDSDEYIEQLLSNVISGEYQENKLSTLGDQIKGYKFLHEEIVSRNLFGRRLEQATDEVFDAFDDIINSKPDEDGTQ